MFKWAIFHSYVKEPGVYMDIYIYCYIAESTKLLRLCESFFYGPKPVVTGTFCAANLSFGPTAQERTSL